ncbi:MAG: hypothetical protein V1721_09970 [Pseudomonadota bacterium]
MNDEDKELLELLKAGRFDDVPPELAERIVCSATALPQEQPLRLKWRNFLERALSDWQYGLSCKMASFAVCAMLGLGIGMYQQSEEYIADEYAVLDIVAVAFVENELMEIL